MSMMMGQGDGEAAPSTGGEPTAASVIVATTIILFLFFLHQVFISRPRNKGGVTTAHAIMNLPVIADAAHCCADCGQDGGASLNKACKSCMLVRYCNADCQRNHWPKHKKKCKQRAAELRDEALFKDPPALEDCPICFLPMPLKLICCMSLPPATISYVPICDYAIANVKLSVWATKQYYECCGKSVCVGCIHSFGMSGNNGKCPFCNSERMGKTNDEVIERIMKRVEANDAGAICQLGGYYYLGKLGLHQDRAKGVELFTQAADLGSSQANYNLGMHYDEGGAPKKAKFHWEAAAIAGHEGARFSLGAMEYISGNMERAINHWTISASAGESCAMHQLRTLFEKGHVGRESIDSILIAYNASCMETRSEARDKYINIMRTRPL